MSHRMPYLLLTFYHFIDIPDLHEHIKEHLMITKDIGMKWRIYLWPEWISATLTGNPWQISAYRLYLSSKPYYQWVKDIDIKATPVKEYYFDRMIVKYRDEIVALNYPVTPAEVSKYKQEVGVEQVKTLIDHREQKWVYQIDHQSFEGRPCDHVVLLDMRNSYEYKLGHYKYAVPSWTVNFRDMHKLITDYKKRFEGKKVIMYCTWGIRCEKLAVMLHKHWLQNFFSIDGGIVKYANTYNDGNWLWNLYTFDGRISTFIGDKQTHTTIGRCIYSSELTDHIENCRYSSCNARIICAPSAYRMYLWFCSKECCDHAIKTLRVKNVKRDKRDYQRIRDDIKKHPESLWEYQTIIGNFYQSRLSDTTWSHLTSQKEEYIDCEC